MKSHYLLLAFLPLLSLVAQPPEGARPSPWSVGVFTQIDSSPYVDADVTTRVFPSVAYRSETLQWLGPLVRQRLKKTDSWSVFVHGAVQFAAYEEDDSPVLEGLGDRSDTFLLGADLEVPLPWRLDFRLSLDGEVLGAHDGTQATAALTRNLGSFRSPLSGALGIGVLFQDQNWTRNSVGVPAEKETDFRSAYSPEESFHPFLAASGILKLSRHWSIVALARIEFLDETWRDSPIIEDDERWTGFVNLSYTF